MSAPLAERLVRVLLFEQPLLESARFDQCRNYFCTHLYSPVRPSGHAEGATRRGQDDLGAHVARWRGLGHSRMTLGHYEMTPGN